ncbi:peflin-like [Ischnura elegans]|uniref:peflin-like n=1 Tax=Ischnura elegans TaxID=197161 RepID=UPI001ED8A17B|nr:peflin-like [Ischnura elegans]
MSYPNAGSGYPGSGYAGGQAGSGYPGQGYPGAQPGGGYPGGQPGGGYPGPQPGYPGVQQGSGYPGGGPASGYPGGGGGGYPGGYGGAGAYPGVSPEIQQWFSAVDQDRSGKISAKELQGALMNGQGKNFSESACRLMIGMFDRDKSGTIDVMEFQSLYNYINQWLGVFRTYDRDGSGLIDESELSQALQQMGYRFTPEFVKNLISRSDPVKHNNISVDQFIVICVQIQRFTEAFKQRDHEMKGLITIGFEEFLTVALSCST